MKAAILNGGEKNRDHKTKEGRSADMSDSWVVQNLNNALNTWNEKLAEVHEWLHIQEV